MGASLVIKGDDDEESDEDILEMFLAVLSLFVAKLLSLFVVLISTVDDAIGFL